MSRFCAIQLPFSIFFLGSLAFGQDNWPIMLQRRDGAEIAGYGEEKISTIHVIGSIICEANSHSGGQKPHALPIKGVSVAVNCCYSCATERRKEKSMVARGVTDEFGDFIVDLPSHLHAINNLEKICRVKILGIPKGSMCLPFPAHIKRQKGLKLLSLKNGIRIYDAGNIRFQYSASKAFGHLVTHE